MTNQEIIEKQKMFRGMPLETPLYTYAEWKQRGFQVKRGESSKIKFKIWKKSKSKKTEDDEEKKSHFFLVNTAFFTFNQVEKIGGEA